jgi:hypothetical protein
VKALIQVLLPDAQEGSCVGLEVACLQCRDYLQDQAQYASNS